MYVTVGEARKAADLTREKLAVLSDTSMSFIGNLERDHDFELNVTVQPILAIARALDLSAAEVGGFGYFLTEAERKKAEKKGE